MWTDKNTKSRKHSHFKWRENYVVLELQTDASIYRIHNTHTILHTVEENAKKMSMNILLYSVLRAQRKKDTRDVIRLPAS